MHELIMYENPSLPRLFAKKASVLVRRVLIGRFHFVLLSLDRGLESMGSHYY